MVSVGLQVTIGFLFTTCIAVFVAVLSSNGKHSTPAIPAYVQVVDRPTKLMIAAYAGDAVRIERLLDDRNSGDDDVTAQIQAVDTRGMATLHYALEARNNDLQSQSDILHGHHEVLCSV